MKTSLAAVRHRARGRLRRVPVTVGRGCEGPGKLPYGSTNCVRFMGSGRAAHSQPSRRSAFQQLKRLRARLPQLCMRRPRSMRFAGVPRSEEKA